MQKCLKMFYVLVLTCFFTQSLNAASSDAPSQSKDAEDFEASYATCADILNDENPVNRASEKNKNILKLNTQNDIEYILPKRYYD